MDATCSECENQAANFCSKCSPSKYFCEFHSQDHLQNMKGHTFENAFKIIDNKKQSILKVAYSGLAKDINAQIVEYTTQANYMIEAINKSVSSLIQLSHELTREFCLSIESSLSYKIVSAKAFEYYSKFRIKNTKLAKTANKIVLNIEKKKSKITESWNKMIEETKKFNVNNRIPIESRRSLIEFSRPINIQFNRGSLYDLSNERRRGVQESSVSDDEDATASTTFKCECLSNYKRIRDELIKDELKRGKKKCQKCLNLEKCNKCKLWCDKNTVKSTICLDCTNEDICRKCKKIMEKCFICQNTKMCYTCLSYIYCFECRKYYPLSSLKEYNLQEYAFRDKCLHHLEPLICSICSGIVPKNDSENSICLKCLDKGKCFCMNTENLDFLSVHRKCRKCAGYSVCNKCGNLEKVEDLEKNDGFCSRCEGSRFCKICGKKTLDDEIALKSSICIECVRRYDGSSQISLKTRLIN
ncbi:hypothetical protein SteCoe_1896 [Stentor coeruleus]|uniref:Uncharacterized protein n=1 Tax=Stentor coeruleus TaxID=5963 RepID=A0A1R2D0S8_9CILI|nr:hypothetical protein SteCoe_1896 [Stentor coeruleus]